MSPSDPDEDAAIAAALCGAPEWITPELMRNTLRTFQPYYKERLSAGDALEMLLNVGALYNVLFELEEREEDCHASQQAKDATRNAHLDKNRKRKTSQHHPPDNRNRGGGGRAPRQ